MRRELKPTDERGAALVIALMAIVLMVAMGSALILLTATETRIVGHQRSGAEALHAADSAIALVLGDLERSDWNAVLAGGVTSTFVDGGPTGVRNTVVGTLDLDLLTRTARMASRRWGANAALWQPYAYGPMRDLAGTDSDVYAVVWVGDDPAECDGRPDVDGGACDARPNPGTGVVALLAHAYGLQGAERAVEVTVARDGPRLRLLSWREIRAR
jgi:hypothetical protein